MQLLIHFPAVDSPVRDLATPKECRYAQHDLEDPMH